MGHSYIGAIKRTKWAFIALVFLLTQFFPLFAFNNYSLASKSEDTQSPPPNAEKASIQIIKYINQNESKSKLAGKDWSFKINENIIKTDVDGKTAITQLVAGSYSVSEVLPDAAIPNDYKVTSAACYDSNNNGIGIVSGNTISDIDVIDGDVITCVFYNDLSNKILICHGRSSETNIYGPMAIDVDKDSIEKSNGHDGHDGPIWYPGIVGEWGDIIPPFQYEDGYYPGQNWTTEGIAIWKNDCQIPHLDKKPTLQLVKAVVGNANPTAWTLIATNVNGTSVINQTGALQEDGTAATPVKEVDADTYALSESDTTGYDPSEWQCTAGSYSAINNTITLANNQNAVCTITNTERIDLWVEKYNDTNNDGKAPNYNDANKEPRATVPFEFTLYKDNVKVTTASTDANGSLSLGSYAPGTYTVCESAKDRWLNTYVYPDSLVGDPDNLNRACVSKTLTAGQDWTFVFANYEQPKPVTIVATKIVCSKESDLPNWGNGAANITSDTATNWIKNHTSCKLTQDWDFQWSYDGVGNPGDNIEYAVEGWTTFGKTDATGSTTLELKYDTVKGKKLWFREALKSGYLGFTYNENGNSNNVSAEFYCNNDVLNYDNWEWIDNMQPGSTYYCVAWNFKKGETITGTKWLDKNADSIKDFNEKVLPDWEIFIDANNDKKLNYNEIKTKTDTFGYYAFNDLQPGTYSICEVQQDGYMQTYPEKEACHSVKLEGATVDRVIGNAAQYDFGNTKAGTIIVKKKIKDQYNPCECESECRCVSETNGVNYEQFSFAIKSEITNKVVYQGSFDNDGVVTIVLPEGKYSVKEDYTPLYWPSYKDCKDIRVTQLQNKYCTITNKHKPADIDIDKQDYGLDAKKDPTVQANPENGADFYYLITINNRSEYSAKNVEVSDDLPSTLKLSSIVVSDPNWECDAPNGTWGQKFECEYDDDYPAKTTTTIRVYVELKEGTVTDLKNTACVEQLHSDKKECDDSNTPVKSITIVADAICRNDFPYMNWSVKPKNVVPTHITLQWFTVDGNDAGTGADQTRPEYIYTYILADAIKTMGLGTDTYTFSDGTVISHNKLTNTYSAEALWPGSNTSASNPDWPGWNFVNDVWIKDPTDVGGDLRPRAKLVITVNPTAAQTEVYPPATPLCNPNPPTGVVKVTKYHDKNQNGKRDETYFNQDQEPIIPGIKLALKSESLSVPLEAITGQDGVAIFYNVPDGYYTIEEVLPENSQWKIYEKTCTVQETPIETAEGTENSYDFYIGVAGQAECTVGNVSTKHYYNILKTNNATSAKRVGDTVTYTITLTIPNDTGVLYNPRVGDAPPTGFKYIAGSWTATSNLRGNLKPGVSTEPTYASPGIWRFNGFDAFYDEDDSVLNDAFYPGEVVTLTYQTKIQEGVSAGVYPDVALSLSFTQETPDEDILDGTVDRNTIVLANVTNQGGTTPFVGTQVEVIVDPPAPQTVLVNTGSGAIWALVMGTSLIVVSLATRRLASVERRIK